MTDKSALEITGFYYKIDIAGDPATIEVLKSYVFQLGTTGIEERDGGFTAFFSQEANIKQIVSAIDSCSESLTDVGLATRFECKVSKEPNEDWNALWKQGMEPVEIGETFIIVTPWHHYAGDRIKVVIDSGMAFGTGHHATTKTCLEEIIQLSQEKAGSFLDIGTGTGILATSAAIVGYSPVHGIDDDAVAINVARHNAMLNNRSDIQFFNEGLTTFRGTYDVVVANLTAETIKTFLTAILELTAPDGILILSGILASQSDMIQSLTHDLGSTIKHVNDQGWCTFVLRKTSDLGR